jgi:hypothetical protein
MAARVSLVQLVVDQVQPPPLLAHRAQERTVVHHANTAVVVESPPIGL